MPTFSVLIEVSEIPSLLTPFCWQCHPMSVEQGGMHCCPADHIDLDFLKHTGLEKQYATV